MIILVIDDGGKERLGKIFVKDRIIYHAEFENLEGNEALRRMIDLPIKRVYIMKNDRSRAYKSMNVEVDEALLFATFSRENNLRNGVVTRFIYPNKLVEEISKVEDVIALFFVVLKEASEIVDIEYISDEYRKKKIELASSVLSIVKEIKKLDMDYEHMFFQRNSLAFFIKPALSNMLVVVGKDTMSFDVLKIIVDKTK